MEIHFCLEEDQGTDTVMVMIYRSNIKIQSIIIPYRADNGTNILIVKNIYSGHDGDYDDVDDDLYIMGAVCLCVCYVFSYFTLPFVGLLENHF